MLDIRQKNVFFKNFTNLKFLSKKPDSRLADLTSFYCLSEMLNYKYFTAKKMFFFQLCERIVSDSLLKKLKKKSKRDC